MTCVCWFVIADLETKFKTTVSLLDSWSGFDEPLTYSGVFEKSSVPRPEVILNFISSSPVPVIGSALYHI